MINDISNENFRKRIAKYFGIRDTLARIILIVSRYNPINQTSLKKKLEKQINRRFSKPALSKKCKYLVTKKDLLDEDRFGRSTYYTLKEETLERLRKDTLTLEFAYLNSIISNTLSVPNTSLENSQEDECFQEEEKLYNEGRWDECITKLREYRTKLKDHRKDFSPLQESKRQRLLARCYYHLGIKGEENLRISRGNKARKAFTKVLRLAQSKDDVDSALSMLPLVYYFLLEEPKKAIKIAEKAENIVSNKASVYNTQGIIEREEGRYIEALKAFSKAVRAGEEMKDCRTCGNAANNIARISMHLLVEQAKLTLGRERLFSKEFLRKMKEEVISQFEKAKEYYKEYEEVYHRSAEFHINGIDEKIRELNENPILTILLK